VALYITSLTISANYGDFDLLAIHGSYRKMLHWLRILIVAASENAAL